MADTLEWKPNPKQEKFLRLPFSIREALYGGGAGSGKSDVLLLYGIAHRLHENPRFKQVFQRRTFPELRNEIIPRSREYYLKFGATFNKSDMAWTFPRPDQLGGTGMGNLGAMIFLGHCENEDDVHKYDSMEISLYTPDELTSFTEYIYLYIGFTRVRAPKDSGLPSIIRAAGMPGGIGHTFVNNRFVKPAPGGSKIIVGRGNNKRIYIHSTQADNKDHVDPTYAQSLEALPEAEKRAKKYGDWDAYQGQVFSEFRDKRYPDEPENALHVIPEFKIPEWWPRILVGDWGYAAQTYLLWGAVSPARRLYVYREQSFKRTKVEEWAPFVKEFLAKENVKIVKFCQSVKQERGLEHTIQEQINIALGVQIELTGNTAGSRIAGKALLHEFLRWEQKHIPEQEKLIFSDEKAAWILRNQGLEDYKTYLSLFKEIEPEDNLPKLQIFDCCPLLSEAIKACVYAKAKDNKPAEDVMEFDGDDPYDTIRYLCDSADAYFNEAIEEFKLLKKQEDLIKRLSESGDWTPYYRAMEQIESESAQEFKPVRRYRH